MINLGYLRLLKHSKRDYVLKNIAIFTSETLGIVDRTRDYHAVDPGSIPGEGIGTF